VRPDLHVRDLELDRLILPDRAAEGLPLVGVAQGLVDTALGEPFKKEAAIAKLVSSNAAMDNARDATQIFGGYGFMNEYPVGRFYRDAKILEVGEGTSEVQRMLIARQLGL
jgi:alkylation response protein AidB-like acyl-CoA dehydrogenase